MCISALCSNTHCVKVKDKTASWQSILTSILYKYELSHFGINTFNWYSLIHSIVFTLPRASLAQDHQMFYSFSNLISFIFVLFKLVSLYWYSGGTFVFQKQILLYLVFWRHVRPPKTGIIVFGLLKKRFHDTRSFESSFIALYFEIKL